ncbi:uncharacterized protein LOC134657612 isoform X1 [Cydia amplana]|uniref:uncharacterized protein LOC134647369 isoform X1 n=1 Tax=Cydia amplana TaxID=1869771 RepID=UPI002FE62095
MSSSAHFGILPTFDHHSQTWKTFKSRLLQWFVANKINATSDAGGEQRRAILLSTLIDGTYKLAADLALPKKIEEVPYEDVLKLLEDHFVPKVFGFSERYKFYSAVQQNGETHTQWAARLRGLSADCNFTNVEEVLRDRFMMGMLPGRERDKVFTQDLKELTLTKAVELANAVRCAREVSAGAGQTASTSDQLFKITSDTKDSAREKCAVCGYSNHKTAECRFSNYRCKKCRGKGHLKKMCKTVKCIMANDVSEGDDVFTE